MEITLEWLEEHNISPLHIEAFKKLNEADVIKLLEIYVSNGWLKWAMDILEEVLEVEGLAKLGVFEAIQVMGMVSDKSQFCSNEQVAQEQALISANVMYQSTKNHRLSGNFVRAAAYDRFLSTLNNKDMEIACMLYNANLNMSINTKKLIVEEGIRLIKEQEMII